MFEPSATYRYFCCGSRDSATSKVDPSASVSFSIPIFPSGIGALLRRDAPERLKAALEGREPPYRPRWRASLGQVLEKRVLSAEAGTTAASWLAERREALQVNAQIVTVASYSEGVDRVLGRRSDALFGDRAILLDAAARSPSAGDLVVLGLSAKPSDAEVEAAEEVLRAGQHHLLLGPESRSGPVPARVLICVAVGEPGKSDVSFTGRLVRHLHAADVVAVGGAGELLKAGAFFRPSRTL